MSGALCPHRWRTAAQGPEAGCSLAAWAACPPWAAWLPIDRINSLLQHAGMQHIQVHDGHPAAWLPALSIPPRQPRQQPRHLARGVYGYAAVRSCLGSRFAYGRVGDHNRGQ
jgi:hypothetical protein